MVFLYRCEYFTEDDIGLINTPYTIMGCGVIRRIEEHSENILKNAPHFVNIILGITLL